MAIDDGGPAFPRPISGADKGLTAPPNARFEFSTSQTGMTLRDYIATHALAGILANPSDMYEGVSASDPDCEAKLQKQRLEIAERSYRFADAFLAARKAGAE